MSGLKSFINHVRANQDAFVEGYPDAFRILSEVEQLFECFRAVLDGSERATLVVLAVRCHSFYVTAASAAMGGSTTEVHPLLRAALECAAYAAHLTLHPELDQLWVARVDRSDEAARKAVRETFSHTRVCKSVDQIEQELGGSYRLLYDALIDLGAHPNVIGVMSSFNVEFLEDARTVEHHILTADSRKVIHTAAMACQVGILCAHILRFVFPAVAAELNDDRFLPSMEGVAELATVLASLAVPVASS